MVARIFVLSLLAAIPAFSQSIVSARSGVLNFAEGDVYIGDLPVEHKAGKFPEVREGSELRTEAGRAELLLTPGLILRLGPDSSLRMLSASLIDTRVEFRHGSATIELSDDPKDTVSTLVFHNYEFRFPKRGTFRINSTPREFRVVTGQADIIYVNERRTLNEGQLVSLYGGIDTETIPKGMTDGLDEWSLRRDSQLAAENPAPGDLNGGFDPALTTIPLSGNPFYGISSYSPPISLYGGNYGYGYGMGYGYGSPFNPYGIYGGYGLGQISPVYIYVPYRPTPTQPIYRPPFHTPSGGTGSIYGGGGISGGRPVSVSRPVTVRPSAPVTAHPIGVRPK